MGEMKAKQTSRGTVRKKDGLSSSSEEESTVVAVKEPRVLQALWKEFPFVYRVNDGVSSGFTILQQVCRERGWREFGSFCREERKYSLRGWNLWWRNSIMNINKNRGLSPWQMTNHIPKASNFCRKDVLARYLRRMLHIYGSIYDFYPRTFNLPLEYTRLLTEHSNRRRKMNAGNQSFVNDEKNLSKQQRQEKERSPIWICKPVGKSQGRGITVFNRIMELSYDSSSVVQEYIHRPFLIGGYKWDLRIYVVIPSTNPLTIYAYQEGITRFATIKYDTNDLFNPFAHLTNSSLNKQSPSYKIVKETVGPGCKWTLRRLRRYFLDIGVEDWWLWQRIMSILVLTIIGDANNLTAIETPNCFEFLGFDIIVDQDLKPSLLEVNTNPGLSYDCIVDDVVKKQMLHEMFTLLGLPDGRDYDTLTTLITDPNNSEDDDENIDQPKDFHKNNEKTTNSRNNFNIPKSRNPIKIEDPLKHMYEVTSEHHNKIYNPFFSSSHPNLNELNNFSQYQNKLRNGFRKVQVKRSCGDREELVPNVIVQVPMKQTYLRNRSKVCELPKLRAGIGLVSRDWKKESPIKLGDWVRIFPFDQQTQEIASSSSAMSRHDINKCISQMASYLKNAKEIFKEKTASRDAYYDKIVKRTSGLSTSVWHPHDSAFSVQPLI